MVLHQTLYLQNHEEIEKDNRLVFMNFVFLNQFAINKIYFNSVVTETLQLAETLLNLVMGSPMQYWMMRMKFLAEKSKSWLFTGFELTPVSNPSLTSQTYLNNLCSHLSYKNRKHDVLLQTRLSASSGLNCFALQQNFCIKTTHCTVMNWSSNKVISSLSQLFWTFSNGLIYQQRWYPSQGGFKVRFSNHLTDL